MQIEFNKDKKRYYIQEKNRKRYGYYKKCEFCKKDFFQRDNDKRRFCQHRCYALWLKGRFTKEKHSRWSFKTKQCLSCKKEFRKKPFVLKKRKYCSPLCASKDSSTIFKEGHIGWNRGKSKYGSIEMMKKFHKLKYRSYKRIGGILSIQTIQRVYEDNAKKYGALTCYLCLKLIEFGQDCLEHKIPLSRKGTNEYSNLAIAHQSCNNKKGSKTEKEYRQKVPFDPGHYELRGEN